MFNILKQALIIIVAAGVVCRAEEPGKYAHITQDSISLDLATGQIFFNDELIDQTELPERLKKSYSVLLNAGIHSTEVFDLFEPVDFSDPDVSDNPSTVPADALLYILEQLNSAELSPNLVELNLYMPPTLERNQYHKLELELDGTVLLDGMNTSFPEIHEKQPTENPFVIDRGSESMKINYLQLLSVLRAVGVDAEIAGLGMQNYDSFKVEAVIICEELDGSKGGISAPRMTVKAGSSSSIRVVQNATGLPTYEPWMDDYHQEDLANLGVRFAVKLQVIGDYVRVSGVVIITKATSQEVVLLQEKSPLFSYSCKKTVVPFSIVFPPDSEVVEFPVAKVDGKETTCRLSARAVDKKGMTRKQRERAKALIEEKD